MYNWSIDLAKLRKDPKQAVIWRHEQALNFGLFRTQDYAMLRPELLYFGALPLFCFNDFNEENNITVRCTFLPV